MALLCIHLLLFLLPGTDAAIFTLQNKCGEIIWPGILPGSGKPILMKGGLQLKPGEVKNIHAPKGWSGRFWGRRGCSFNHYGKGQCLTGDCGGKLNCAGAGGSPPATLAEFTLNSPIDFYDVSFVDGYNMKMSIVPYGGSGKLLFA
ncbi:Thaumatin family [Dillenia turbinata]|uniref:Thaumatin family n=1 Tax=Dillenia turbinata TaxID=194707 RepID=A0AAN8VHN0_9MAGN